MGRIRSSAVWGTGTARRQRWLLLPAILVLAVIDSASGDADGEPGAPRPPFVVIAAPEHFAVLVAPSFEVAGAFDGQVDRIEVLLDGQSRAGRFPTTPPASGGCRRPQ